MDALLRYGQKVAVAVAALQAALLRATLNRTACNEARLVLHFVQEDAGWNEMNPRNTLLLSR